MRFVNSPATAQRFLFSPGQAAAFPIPTAGVVTKADIATEEQCRQAEELLALAGADPIFRVSSLRGDGMEELLRFLDPGRGQP